MPPVTKLAPTVSALCIVPDAETVDRTVPRETVAVVVALWAELSPPRPRTT